jgi:preprotein translocase subunit SecG
MFLALLGSSLTYLLPPLSIFLILLILVQRGRGGGLVGAFGGGGGQSAFGAKAGDLFTKITVVTVSIWIVGCIILLLAMKQGGVAGGKWGFDENRTSAPPAAATTETGAPVTTPTPASGPQE